MNAVVTEFILATVQQRITKKKKQLELAYSRKKNITEENTIEYTAEVVKRPSEAGKGQKSNYFNECKID